MKSASSKFGAAAGGRFRCDYWRQEHSMGGGIDLRKEEYLTLRKEIEALRSLALQEQMMQAR